MTTDKKVYLSVAETAKEVRIALKAVFPTVKFSVRSSVYSGGGSIDVRWTDGPTTKRVEAITKRFEGSSFDGMIDLKSYHDTEYQGRQVHFGANYVFANRSYSLAMVQAALEAIGKRYGSPLPRLVTPPDYEPYCDPTDPITNTRLGGGYYTFSDHVHIELSGMEG